MMRSRRTKAARRRWLGAWMVCLTWALSLPAIAEKAVPSTRRQRARTLFVEAKAHYAQAEYPAAIAAFKAAGKLRPSPLLDFNIARCHERMGQARQAIAAYRRYLRGRPRATNRREVRARIAALVRQAADPYEDLERESAAVSPPGSGAASQPASSLPAPATPPAGAATASSQPASRSAAHARQPPTYPHEATLPAGRQGSYGRSGRRPGTPPPRRRPRRPFYRDWSFWVGVGAATVITGLIVGFAVAQDSGSSAQSSGGGLRVTF